MQSLVRPSGAWLPLRLRSQSDPSGSATAPPSGQSAAGAARGHAPREDGGAAGAAVAAVAAPGAGPEAAPGDRPPRGAAAVPGGLGRVRRAPRVHPAPGAGRDPGVPGDGPAGTGDPQVRGSAAAQGAGAEALQDDDAAQHHGQDPVRVPATGPDLVLHDQLRRGGDARGQRRRPGQHRPRVRAVPRGRCAAVPRVPPGAVHGPVLRERARPRQGPPDARALRLPRAPLRHHLVPAGHADPASGGRGLRHQARARQPRRGLLLRRGRGQRGRRPRRLQLRCHPRVPHRLLLPQQRLRHLHAHLGAVPRRRHRGARPRLWAALHPRGRQRRFRRVQRDARGPAARGGREPALPHRGHDLQNWPPQHERRQLRVPLGGRGELLGQAGPPHLPPAALPGPPRLVGRAAGEGVEEELAENGAGGVRAGRAGAEAAAAAALLGRVPGDAPAAAAPAPGAAAAPGDLRRALPPAALPEMREKTGVLGKNPESFIKIAKFPQICLKSAPNRPEIRPKTTPNSPGDLRRALPPAALPEMSQKTGVLGEKTGILGKKTGVLGKNPRGFIKIAKFPQICLKSAPNRPQIHPKLTWRPTGSTAPCSTSRNEPKNGNFGEKTGNFGQKSQGFY